MTGSKYSFVIFGDPHTQTLLCEYQIRFYCMQARLLTTFSISLQPLGIPISYKTQVFENEHSLNIEMYSIAGNA